MLGTYSYHEIIKKTVVGFGTLFNNIELRRVVSGKTEVMKVPLAYGPRQKFLARLNQVGLNKTSTQLTLPRISFEIQGFNYDATRKVSPTSYIRKTASDGKEKKSFMPVPYNLNFELAIMSKNQDDGLQILEQILPIFQPSFNITMNLVEEVGEKRDYPITLTSIDYEDVYEGDYDTRRTLVYTLQFVAKTYLYGPVSDVSGEVIKKAIVDYASKTDRTAPREVRYTVEPDPITADADDNFGFNELTSTFVDAKDWNPVTGADE